MTSGKEMFVPVKDPVILRYLRASKMMREESYKNLKIFTATEGQEIVKAGYFAEGLGFDWYADNAVSKLTKLLKQMSPLCQMWIPTASMLMMEVLAEFFPRHHLFMADWSRVQYSVVGINGPLVQVKIRVAKNQFIRRSLDSFAQNAGMVDLCFPTDFELLQAMYGSICGEHKEVSNMSHPQFWRSFGGDKIALFATKSGYNPIIQDFEAFQVLAAHHPPEM
jgi:hypothetical protein